MTDRPETREKILPIPDAASRRKVLDDYLVYYQTRLPKLRVRAARARANLRWIVEGHYRNPRARPPFDLDRLEDQVEDPLRVSER